jgi:RasGEF domain
LPAHKPKLEAAQIKPYDLAISLTLMEGDKYRVLRPQDYLAFLRKHPGHNPIEDVYNTHNKIFLWVKCSILHYEKTEKRSDALKFFINAALVGETLAPCRSLWSILPYPGMSKTAQLFVCRRNIYRTAQS